MSPRVFDHPASVFVKHFAAQGIKDRLRTPGGDYPRSGAQPVDKLTRYLIRRGEQPAVALFSDFAAFA
ncbi:MAG: hypothetical protein LUE09_00535 [Synergistaceae bacterium]|nr:hypothetical protein [Synergistaceae bacterium]